MRISKSSYVLYLKCPLALWYKKNRPDLQPEFNEAILSQGNDVGVLAQKLYECGKVIAYKPWKPEAIKQTEEFAAAEVDAIFEAVAKTQTDEFCAADILARNDDGSWNIIEVKSSTEAKEYHLMDIAFQYYVFTNAGYKIKDCYVATINNQYERRGKIEPHKLFKFDNVTEEAIARSKDIPQNLAQIRTMKTEPECKAGKCCSLFYECQYKPHCQPPVESVAEEGETIIDHEKIAAFLNKLEYPLYFLDYETIKTAIPLFDGVHPYQQVPFQFSLHIKKTPESELEHVEFLHRTQTDPQEDLIKKLIASCGNTDTGGSVVVYNQSFEEEVNRNLIRQFPEYAQEILSINNRMVDLLAPFKQRALYSPAQNGSASIKKVLPAFTDMSYDDLEITNGGEASGQYLAFVQGQEPQELFDNLLKYCERDTLAMVKLLDVLRDYS